MLQSDDIKSTQDGVSLATSSLRYSFVKNVKNIRNIPVRESLTLLQCTSRGVARGGKGGGKCPQSKG